MKHHGLSKQLLYHVWSDMKERCYNINYKHCYPYYGKRGITVCAEWLHSPATFIAWANSHGYKKGLQLDRKNNDGSYCPENCRFVTPHENYLKEEKLYNKKKEKQFTIVENILQEFT